MGRGKIDIDESMYTEVPSPPDGSGGAADGRPAAGSDINRRIAAVMRDTSLTPQERQRIIQDIRSGAAPADAAAGTSSLYSGENLHPESPQSPPPPPPPPEPVHVGGGGSTVRSELAELQALQERENAAARAAEERRLEALQKRGFRGFDGDRPAPAPLPRHFAHRLGPARIGPAGPNAVVSALGTAG